MRLLCSDISAVHRSISFSVPVQLPTTVQNTSGKTQSPPWCRAARMLCAHATDANIQPKVDWVTKWLGILEVIESLNLQQSLLDFYRRSLLICPMGWKLGHQLIGNLLWWEKYSDELEKDMLLLMLSAKLQIYFWKSLRLNQHKQSESNKSSVSLEMETSGVEWAKTVFPWSLAADFLKSIKRNISVQFCTKQI